MRIFLKEHGLKVIDPEDNHASFHRWDTLESGADLIIDREPEPDVAEWAELESFLSDKGIDLSKPDPYQQHLDFLEAKQLEEVDRIAQEQAEREAFDRSPAGKALGEEKQKNDKLDSVDRLTDAMILDMLIEEKKKELNIDSVKQKVRKDIQDGKVSNVTEAVRGELKKEKKK